MLCIYKKTYKDIQKYYKAVRVKINKNIEFKLNEFTKNSYRNINFTENNPFL